MIHVDRPKDGPKPLWLPLAEHHLQVFYEHELNKSFQRRYVPDEGLYRDDELLQAVAQVFHGKCAYCESEVAPPNITHHRPPSLATNIDGTVDDKYYWWLTYQWFNLYNCCRECASKKANYFAVDGPRSGKINFEEPRLILEKPLLLDPCEDFPEDYLEISGDGKVRVSTPEISAIYETCAKRANYTIETLALNRLALVKKRQTLLNSLNLSQRNKRAPQFLDNLFSMVESNETPHLLLVCWTIARLALRSGIRIGAAAGSIPPLGLLTDRQPAISGQTTTGRGSDLSSELLQRINVINDRVIHSTIGKCVWLLQCQEDRTDRESTVVVRRPRKPQAAAVDQPAAVTPQERVESSIKSGAQISVRSAYLKRIKIRNFKNIHDLTVELSPKSNNTSCNWLVLLGENGCGKSSLLQAAALALVGEAQAKTIREHCRDDFLRRPGRGESAPASGIIEVILSDVEKPVVVALSKSGLVYKSRPEGAETYVRGYGPIRLVDRDGSHHPAYSALAHVDVRNLFDEWSPLVDPEKWLSVQSQTDFDNAAKALRALLDLPAESTLTRENGRVFIENSSGVRVSLSELSSGYKAVLHVAVDLMKGVLDARPGVPLSDMPAFFGIVLLDELGAYLHPRWRMRVVKQLKAAFPTFQFLAMTHEPLCLRGLGNSEVAVLRLDEEGKVEVLAGTDLPLLNGLRADQILTSEIFGLHSTLDPDTERDFNRYYQLLAKTIEPLSPEEQKEIEELRGGLKKHAPFGGTYREQRMYDILDKGLAKERAESDPKRKRVLADKTKKEVLDIWRFGSIESGTDETR